jgi:hypothetical protein
LRTFLPRITKRLRRDSLDRKKGPHNPCHGPLPSRGGTGEPLPNRPQRAFTDVRARTPGPPNGHDGYFAEFAVIRGPEQRTIDVDVEALDTRVRTLSRLCRCLWRGVSGSHQVRSRPCFRMRTCAASSITTQARCWGGHARGRSGSGTRSAVKFGMRVARFAA